VNHKTVSRGPTTKECPALEAWRLAPEIHGRRSRSSHAGGVL